MAKHKIALDKQYIRNKQPVSTEDQDGIVGVAFAGYSFEGEKIDTEWYKDSNGNFYWAGGVVSFDSLIATQIDYGKIDYEKHWWYQKLEIQKLHETLGTKGKGANILVLDMGIPDGSPLLKNIRLDTQNSYNFSNQIEDKNLHTPSNHGIVMANFIGSKNTDCPGIAPDANIIMGKIAMDGHSIGMRRLIRALTFYSESNIPIDVVSISGGASNYANPNDPEIGEIKNLIKKFIESKNAIVVAALGNGENNDDEDFPARFEQVIGVGSVTKNGKDSDFTKSPQNAKIKVFGEGYTFPLSISDKEDIVNGTSVPTAMASALFAIAISYYKTTNDATFDTSYAQRLILESLNDNKQFSIQKLSQLINPTIKFV